MKKPVIAVLLVLGILSYSSCKSNPKVIEQNESEEVQTDTLEHYSLMEDEEGF